MTKSQIAVRIPPLLLERLNSYVKRTGTSKTEVVVGAIAEYLGCAEDIPLTQRMARLEERMAELEALVKAD
ncbi:MAG: DNA-binding domain-containing protein [Xenococcaceae cyanobacterium]